MDTLDSLTKGWEQDDIKIPNPSPTPHYTDEVKKWNQGDIQVPPDNDRFTPKAKKRRVSSVLSTEQSESAEQPIQPTLVNTSNQSAFGNMIR
mgnify:CR=1 FL=1